jgi:2-polyprenyl-3-methyl-5-hydroxy-6-metoxy-1,4-benzoquinol methylase
MHMFEQHWDAIYATTDRADLAWYEPEPSTLAVVTAHSTPDDPVVDVGGASGTLAIALARRGYRDVTVLDISERGLDASRAELWQHTDVVTWIHADVTAFEPARQWRLWHDRAVFHFLTDARDRDAYRSAASSAVSPGGIAVVATFAPDGPEQCAGLPVRRYDVAALAAQFAPEFDFVDGQRLTPPSSLGDQRPYVGVVLRRIG